MDGYKIYQAQRPDRRQRGGQVEFWCRSSPFSRAALDAKLDGYVGRHGGPNALLHFGAKRTSEIAVAATVRTTQGTGVLSQRLGFRAPDNLFFYNDRSVRDVRVGEPPEIIINDVCSLVMTAGDGPPDEAIYYGLRDGVATYHLVDTSLTSPIRTEVYIEINKRLSFDGGNLAAVLYRYKRTNEKVYSRSVPRFKRSCPRSTISFWSRGS